MKVNPISTFSFNKINFVGNNKQTPTKSSVKPTNVAKIPLATLIAISPLVSTETNAQIQNCNPEQVVITAHEDTTKLNPKTKILDVKTFFDVNGQNYIVKTKSTDGDDSNFENVTITQATPNSCGINLKTKEIARYNYVPLDDTHANNGVITVESIKVEDPDSNEVLIGNKELIQYFEELFDSPQNNSPLEDVHYFSAVKPIPSGRITSNKFEGNRWENADAYCPFGEYLGEKKLQGDNGFYTIAIYNSDEQNLTAEEFTLQKDFLPELKIDKMLKVKHNFITDEKEPITYETYQFNLKDENGATTVIYDKTLGEYMERVCKCPLYNKKNVPFEKAEIEKNYEISANTGKIYLKNDK